MKTIKKPNKFTVNFVLILLLVVFIAGFVAYMNDRADTAKSAQQQSDQARSNQEKESRKQDLLSQRDLLNKNIQAKQKEGESYKKLSNTYCGYLNPPAGSILLQTDYQTYFQQCEEYKRKAIDTYAQAQTLINEYDNITQKLNTGNY